MYQILKMAVGYNHLHAKNHIFLQEYGFDKFYKNDAVLKGLLRPPPHHTPSPPPLLLLLLSLFMPIIE